MSTGLAKGEIVMAHCYNYDVAVAQQSSKNIAWVVPTEGTVGYVEGFIPIAGAKHLDTAYAFLNYHLDPKVYATFVNATGSSWVEVGRRPVHHRRPAHQRPAQADRGAAREG